MNQDRSALTFTLFFRHEAETSALINHFVTGLELSLSTQTLGNAAWEGQMAWDEAYPSAFVWLEQFTSFRQETARNTTLLQLTLTQDKFPPHKSWPYLQKHLSQLMAEVRQNEHFDFHVLIGHTLIYHARLADITVTQAESPALRQALRELQPYAQPLIGIHQPQTSRGLAHQWHHNTLLTLMRSPHERQARDTPKELWQVRGTLYIALSPSPKAYQKLIQLIGASPEAPLMLIDMLLNKSAWQRHQYHGRIKAYQREADELSQNAISTLSNIHENIHRGKNAELNHAYAKLLSTITELQRIKTTLDGQLRSFQRLTSQLPGDVIAYHQDSIELTLEQLRLLIEQGQDVLLTTRTAVSAIDTQYAQKRAEHDWNIQIWFRIIAVVFALLGVFNHSYFETFILPPLQQYCPDTRRICLLTHSYATPIWQMFLVGTFILIGASIKRRLERSQYSSKIKRKGVTKEH